MSPASILERLFDSRCGASDRLLARWLLLRALGLIYFSAFYSLLFQIRGLIGNNGILPATEFLEAVAHSYGPARFWFAPSLFWMSTGNGWLMAVCGIGLFASVLLVFNLWPRAMLGLLCVLPVVCCGGRRLLRLSVGWDAAGGRFHRIVLCPAECVPGWGESPPSRASLFLLQWEWFRIYFESGMVKLLSGDPEWRHLTAMDEYYQNGPLPTWVGWYVATSSALVSCFHRGRYVGDGAGDCCDVFSARRAV